MKVNIRTLSLAIAFAAALGGGIEAHAQARITNIYRWQEVQQPIPYPLGPCSSTSPRSQLEVYTQIGTGYWGANLVYGRAFNGRPITMLNSYGTATAAVAADQFWPGDAVLGNQSGFGQMTLHPKATLKASTNDRCAMNNFYDARAGMTVDFTVDRTEIFAFYGTITSSTTWQGLVSVSASLVCNGASMFNVGPGSHDYSFTLTAGQSCRFTIAGSSRAEATFSDISEVAYDVVLKSDG